MSEKLPKATHLGSIVIGTTKIECAVLDNEQRVLTQTGFIQSMGRIARGSGGQGALAHKLPVFLRAKNLEPLLTDEIMNLIEPIPFRSITGQQAIGYAADLLPLVCELFLKAKDLGMLVSKQQHIAEHCSILVRGLSRVGIAALIDEATGYQEVRNKQALHKILEMYISKELLPWAKRFPDEYYKELFRLRNWSYDPMIIKRPSYVGKLTNQLIYEKLPPGVLEELQKKNPKNESGNRLHKHHQLLTDDIGNRHLEKHIAIVTAFMRASPNWESFETLFARAFKEKPEQLEAAPVSE